MIGCDSYLSENGMPSQCALALSNHVTCATIAPLAFWTSYRLVVRDKRVTASKLRYTGFVFGLLSLFLQRDIYSLITLAIVLFEQWFQLQKSQICGGEVLIFYLVQAALGALQYRNWTLAYTVPVLSFLAFLGEFYGSDTRPLGFDNATVFGKLSISYVEHMLRVSRKGQITHEDFAEVPKNMSTSLSFFLLSREYIKANNKTLRAVIGFNFWRIVAMLVLDTFATMVNYLRPLLLAAFLTALANYQNGASVYPPIYLGSLIGLVQLAIPALNGVTSILNTIIGTQTRAALMETIYRKSTKLSNDSRVTYDSSKIMNLLNVDTAIIQNCNQYFPTLLQAPIGIVICTWQLYHFIGNASFAAIPVYMFFIPYSSWHTKRMFKRFPELMKVKDVRTKSLWGILRNIKSLKLYAWEEPYEKQVEEHRNAEIDVQRKYLRLISIMRSLSITIDDIVAACVFIAYLAYSGKALTPEIVFPTLSLLSFLSDPFTSLPSSVSGIGRTLASANRINDFLDQPEHSSINYSEDAKHAVHVENANIYWSETSKPVLTGVNLTLESGDLCCVVGRVGTGKTALLKALCNQMYVESGLVGVSGSIAYCPQEPWLQFKTVRDNILFGLEFDEEFYQRTIKACELEADIKNLPQGDLTQVGEKGICLSGGQKARVALARAVYSRSDIYLLDDILSAVDEHVSHSLVTNLFTPTGLLAGRTIVLATNSKPVLKHASVLLNVTKDSWFLSSPSDPVLPSAVASQVASEAPSEAESAAQSAAESRVASPEPENKGYNLSREAFESTRLANLDPPKFSAPQVQAETSPKILHEMTAQEEEDKNANVVQVFARYFKSVGMRNVVVTMVLFLSAVVIPNLILVWLTIWSDKELKGLHAAKSYVAVYLGLSFSSGVFVFLSVYWFYGRVGNTASFNLHAQMVTAVLQSPLSFFDKTPMGSIMNRFTGDISTLDQTVPNTLYNFCRTFLMAVANFTITLVGAPFLIVVIIPLLMVYNNFRRAFIPCSRQLQRIMSASRGPILSHIEESVKGFSTINAFQMWPQFVQSYRLRSDYWMEASFLYTSLSRWLNWRIRLITVAISWSAAMSLVALVGVYPLFSIGLAGMVMHTTQRAAMLLSRIIRTAANIEISAVAIERIFEFCDLEQEAARTLPSDAKFELTEGAIQFDNYSTRYRPELPIVLKGISLNINPEEKIGVVGRTGASKSTLCLSLFRILEAAEGNIGIDSHKISDLGLKTLRSQLSIIPQDAQIFAGTLRSNLNPLGDVGDERLWEVLELCHLSEHFGDFEEGLATPLLEGGENLSRGQAQLICLGRALLHDSKVLVLDEATASVDTETDAIVQQTIRTQFKHKTIVTIAHRLNTIMDCDRILVLSHGKVVEFDTPKNLLEAKGEFWELAQRPEQL